MIFKIGGVDMPAPETFEPSIQDIDGENSNRDLSGTMYRDRIAVKRKLNLQWGPLTQDESSKLLNAVSNEFFECTFIDPQLGQITKTMYVGDRSIPALVEDDNGLRWKNLKMNFVER